MFNNDGTEQNNTIEDPFNQSDLLEDPPSDFKEVEDDDELCDCDPKHKESQTVQRSAGASFGGVGGKVGDGTTVIVCTKCGGRFYEDKDSSRGTNDLNSLF
jgi:hypothetical protein